MVAAEVCKATDLMGPMGKRNSNFMKLFTLSIPYGPYVVQSGGGGGGGCGGGGGGCGGCGK